MHSLEGGGPLYIRAMSKISYVVAAALLLAAMGIARQVWHSMAGIVVGTAGILAMIFGALATACPTLGRVSADHHCSRLRKTIFQFLESRFDLQLGY
jgi:hypothetical protein